MLRVRLDSPCEAHAVLSLSPASSTHDRNRTVFPLPAGAEMIVTRPASASRANNRPRATIPAFAAGEAGAPAVCDRAARPTGLPIIAPAPVSHAATNARDSRQPETRTATSR
jgi:hypothetical protein